MIPFLPLIDVHCIGLLEIIFSFSHTVVCACFELCKVTLQIYVKCHLIIYTVSTAARPKLKSVQMQHNSTETYIILTMLITIYLM